MEHCQLLIPSWVPDAPRQALMAIAATIASPELERLQRLAAHDNMRHVWEGLPKSPSDGAHKLLLAALYCSSSGHFHRRLNRRLPRDKKKAHDRILRYPPEPGAAHVANSATILLRGMIDLAGISRDWWPRLWKGDPAISFDDLLQHLEQLQHAYCRLAEEEQRILGDLPIKNSGAKDAEQRAFIIGMSRLMQLGFGQPLDKIVSIVAEVVFDLPARSVSTASTRNRRRAGADSKRPRVAKARRKIVKN